MASHTELLKRLRKNPWNSKYPRMKAKKMSTLEPQNKTKHANSKIPRLQTLERDFQILTCRSRKSPWFIQIFATVFAFPPSQFAYCVGFCKIFEIVGGLVYPCYTIVREIALRVSTFFIKYQSARFCEICSFVSISDSCLICSCICSPRYMESSELARDFSGDSLEDLTWILYIVIFLAWVLQGFRNRAGFFWPREYLGFVVLWFVFVHVLMFDCVCMGVCIAE